MRKHYDISRVKKNPYAERLKKASTIRLDESTVEYFKELADETELPYQSLVNLYLRDCAATGRRLMLNWRPARTGAASRHSLGGEPILPSCGEEETMKKITRLSILLLLAAARLPAQALPADSLFDRLIGHWMLRGTIARQSTTHDVTFDWMLGREYVRMHEVS